MIITDPNQLDLTGENSSYKRNLRRFKIFTANQLVDLQDSAYANTLEVWEVTGYDENSNPILSPLPKGSGNYAKHWYTSSSNQDVTAMSKAKYRYSYDHIRYLRTTDIVYSPDKTYYVKTESDTYVVYTGVYTPGTEIPAGLELYELDKPVWDFVLVNGFYMTDSAAHLEISGEYEIAVSYQGLEIECSAISRDNLGPAYSPGLMRSVLDKIEELYYVRNPINHVFSESISEIHCLEEDLTGTKEENHIFNEIHTIDVANNRFVVRPQCGSFYNQDLEVKFRSFDGLTETVLEQGVDYVVTGVNKEKTSISDPSCGVYEYIIIKQSYTGYAVLSYHAFGGDVTQADINALKEAVQDIYLTFTSMDILTVSNLKDSSLIRELLYRQQLIEHTIGHYQSQHFLYQLGSDDKFINVAFIGRNPWTDDVSVPTSGVGEFRVKIPDLDFFMNIKVVYDLDAEVPLSIAVYHMDIPSFDRNGFPYFTKRIFPKFRLLWCSDALGSKPAADRGIMLQMSLTSVNTNTYGVTIEDMTGAKSPWELVDTHGEIRPSINHDPTNIEYYTNTAVRYGNYEETSGTKVYYFDWKSSNDYQFVVSVYPNGYTIFAGDIPINTIEEASVSYTDPEFGDLPQDLSGYDIVPVINGSDIDLTKVKSVEFKVYDAFTEKTLIGRSQELISQNTRLVAEAMYFTDDLCMLSCVIEHNNGYSMKLLSRTGTNSLNNNRFSLVQINLIG